MSERGPGTPGDGDDDRGFRRRDGDEGRSGRPTRLTRREEARESGPEPVEAEPIEVEPYGPEPYNAGPHGAGPGGRPGMGGLGPLFGPRSFRGGRVQVWGCSPGCLLVSLLVSVALTILLNLMIGLF